MTTDAVAVTMDSDEYPRPLFAGYWNDDLVFCFGETQRSKLRKALGLREQKPEPKESIVSRIFRLAFALSR